MSAGRWGWGKGIRGDGDFRVGAVAGVLASRQAALESLERPALSARAIIALGPGWTHRPARRMRQRRDTVPSLAIRANKPFRLQLAARRSANSSLTGRSGSAPC